MDGEEPAALEITPERAYLNRRDFLRRSGILALGGLAIARCTGPYVPGTAPAEPGAVPVPAPPSSAEDTAGDAPTPSTVGATDLTHDELGNPVTTLGFIRSYGYYYEFSRERVRMGENVGDYAPPKLELQIGGLVERPMTLRLDDLLRLGEEQRVYRHRCVECWAMVIPWTGVPLRRLLEEARPTAAARFVRFEGRLDPKRMPGQQPGAYGTRPEDDPGGMGATVVGPYRWPYVEGLRLDEALHDLTLLATGIYGRPLHPANGAPLRLVVPWKYGFKSIKNITRIDLVEEMPVSFWMAAEPLEHGFYANVNPHVPHPRWAQEKEARYRGVCPERVEPTLMFNGYEDAVARLYAGMDLAENY